jgi:hypothetical protein
MGYDIVSAHSTPSANSLTPLLVLEGVDDDRPHLLAAMARASHDKQKDVARTTDMHARIDFEGDHDEALAVAREAVTAACAAMSDLGYKPGALHAKQKSS